MGGSNGNNLERKSGDEKKRWQKGDARKRCAPIIERVVGAGGGDQVEEAQGRSVGKRVEPSSGFI